MSTSHDRSIGHRVCTTGSGPTAARPTVRRHRSARIAAAATFIAAVAAALGMSPGPSARAHAAASPARQSYGCTDCVFAIAAAEDEVWVGTFGSGIVRVDRRTGAWRRFGRGDGLDADSVRAVAAGAGGVVWAIGYTGGSVTAKSPIIARFDGASWHSFGAAETPWVADLTLGSRLSAGPAGQALVAFEAARPGGSQEPRLARFDGAAWHLDGPAEGVDGVVAVTAFAPDGRAYGWINQTPRRWDGLRWTALPFDVRPLDLGKVSNPFLTAAPPAMAVGADGTVYISSLQGVVRYRETPWPEGSHWRVDRLDLSATAWRTLQADTAGAPAWLLAAAEDGTGLLIYRFDGQRWQRSAAPFPPEPGFGPNAIRAGVAPDGRVWLGSLGGTLAVWDGTKVTVRRTEDGVPKPLMSAVALAPDGHAWAGSYGLFGGEPIVSEFDGVRWRRHGADVGGPVPTSLIGVRIGAMDAADDGTVWAGVEGAVWRHDARGWAHWDGADGVPAGRVSDIAAQSGGRAWAATVAGAAYFDGSSWRRDPVVDAMPSRELYSVAVDERPGATTVWLGGSGQVARFDGARWRRYGADEGVPNVYLYDVAVDAAGTAWFSTDGAGLVACDDARCAISDTGGLVDGATAFGIALDAAGRPWVAQTEGSGGGKAGLVHFDGRSWRRYTTDDGLLDDLAYDVAVGDDGRVWVATFAGVSVFTPPDAPPRPAPSPTPDPTALPAADAPKVCPQLAGAVPRAAIDTALADPAAVEGWMQPVNPSAPAGPFNPPRTWLTLRQPGRAFHPVGNGVVWRAGCP